MKAAIAGLVLAVCMSIATSAQQQDFSKVRDKVQVGQVGRVGRQR